MQDRLAALDWPGIAAALDARGCATTGPLPVAGGAGPHHLPRRAMSAYGGVMIRALAALAVMLAVSAAYAQAPAAVVVGAAWARATPPRAEVAALYLTLTSTVADRLLTVSSPLAGRAAVHTTAMAGGVMRMREADGLPLPAGQAVVLGPGGPHIMLEGLKAPLRPGQSVPFHLTFASAPPFDGVAQVRGVGARP